MSATVRRLVCDVPLRWLLVIALEATAILIVDVAWLLGLIIPRVTLGLLVGMGVMALGQASLKLPIWRLLPVSRRQIARARWWLSVGGPLALLVAGLAVALAVVEAMGWLRAAPVQIAALLGGECALALAIPVISVAGGLSVRTAAGITLLWAAILAALAFSRPGPFFGLAAGAVALAGAAAAYLFPRTALLDAPAPPPRRQAGAGRGQHMKGWAALLRPLLIYAAVLAVSSIGFFVVMRMAIHQISQLRDVSVAAATGMGMLALAPMIFGARIRQSARSLRLVPVSGLALSSILVGAAASVQLLAFATFCVFCRLSHGPADQALALLPLVIGAGAWVLGLTLRGWWQAIYLWPVFALISAPLVDWPPFAAVSVALGAASLAAGWWWTHFELTRGSHVYRPWPTSVATWRGR